MRLHRDRFVGRAVFDTAISHAMLRGVASGSAPESLRLYAPDSALLFSSLDARRSGYPRAVEIARDAGFEPVIRLAGGHAAVFLEESVAFAWASADPDANLHIKPRFEKMSGWIEQALRNLGLDARTGEVPGEYCPGEYSVNIAGRQKVMGVGQRVIRGGAHVGGVITVGQTERMLAVLESVYRALEIEFSPEAAVGLADLDPTITPEIVIDELIDVMGEAGYTIQPATFESGIQRAAEALAPLHGPHRGANAARGLRPAPHTVGGAKALIQQTSNEGAKNGNS